MGVLLWGLGACTIQSVKCPCPITMVSGPMGIGVGASGWVAMGLVGCTINYVECHCTVAMGNVPPWL